MYNKLGVREVKKEEIPTPKKPPGKGYNGEEQMYRFILIQIRQNPENLFSSRPFNSIPRNFASSWLLLLQELRINSRTRSINGYFADDLYKYLRDSLSGLDLFCGWSKCWWFEMERIYFYWHDHHENRAQLSRIIRWQRITSDRQIDLFCFLLSSQGLFSYKSFGCGTTRSVFLLVVDWWPGGL